MKNTAFKYYIAAFYLCSNFVMFAQPGTGSDNGGIDNNGSSDTTPTAPIDDYVWVLAIVGLFFVFIKFRAMQNRRFQE